MAYAMRKNDYNGGTQLNLANYDSLYQLIFFNLSFETETQTDKRSKTINFQI